MNQRILGNAGFTLIEVLVASAISVVSMGLLLSLFGSGLDRLNRIEIQAQQIIVEKEVLSRLDFVNPAQQPMGEGVIGDWKYSWAALPVTKFERVADYFGVAPSPRYVALFKIDIQIKPDQYKEFNFQIERLGWQDGDI